MGWLQSKVGMWRKDCLLDDNDNNDVCIIKRAYFYKMCNRIMTSNRTGKKSILFKDTVFFQTKY